MLELKILRVYYLSLLLRIISIKSLFTRIIINSVNEKYICYTSYGSNLFFIGLPLDIIKKIIIISSHNSWSLSTF